MGGDHGPANIVAGALAAAPHIKHKIILVGDPSKIQEHLTSPVPANIVIHPAMEEIGMHEKPLEAIRKKKDSSLVVAVDLVKQGQALAFVSAGNTGACTAASLLSWRQIHGLHRPAIASELPCYHGRFLLLDSGASPDIDPEHLVEFAVMGRAYAMTVMGRENPRVHLLNIGEEEGKGNAFTKQAFSLLSKHEWFAGNIESKDAFHNPCDVVVCDAFVGNTVLKTAEGIGELILKLVREQVPTNPIKKLGFGAVKKVMMPIKQAMDYAEVGGSPLLGLNGLCVICHGRSNARAIKNALLAAQRGIDKRLVEVMKENIKLDLGVG